MGSNQTRGQDVLIYVKWYTGLVLLLSWAYAAFLFTHVSYVGLFSLVMFLPALTALAVGWKQFKRKRRLYGSLIVPVKPGPLLFAFWYPVAFVATTFLLAVFSGMATFDASGFTLRYVLEHLGSPTGLLIGILLTLGEEYGWRNYLLENLSRHFSFVTATLIVGVVWAFWHAPFLYGLAGLTHLQQPVLVMVVQMLAVLGVSFAFSYSYLVTRSVWPPVIMHYVWNLVNPMVLGSVYSGSSGMVQGDIFMINGEGVLGAGLHLLAALWFIRALGRMEHAATPVRPKK